MNFLHFRETCTNNITKSDEYRRHCKKYSLGTNTFGGTIDLPPELDKNPLPNLGPKVNHHFRDQNSGTVVENHIKSRIQNCERSELRLHFAWPKVH